MVVSPATRPTATSSPRSAAAARACHPTSPARPQSKNPLRQDAPAKTLLYRLSYIGSERGILLERWNFVTDAAVGDGLQYDSGSGERLMRTIKSVDFPGEARTVAAGTTIFRVDDPPDCMYSLAEGEVDILIKGVIVDTIHAGGIFGEMAVIEGDRRAATAVARTDVKLVPLDEQQFRELVQRSPAFAMRMMRVLSDRVRRLNAKLSKDPRP